MSKLETIESLVKKIPCPVCLNSRFEVNLSCDLPKSPCDFHAVCGHCHYEFVITEDFDQKKDIFQKVKEHIEKSGCPECNNEDLEIDFMCDLGTEDCFFLVRCGKDGHYSKVDQNGMLHLFQ